jgi:hypothetical protein
MKITKKTAKKMGSKGGQSTYRVHGARHFQELANKRWSKKKNHEK